MDVLIDLVRLALLVFMLFLFARVVLSFVISFSHDWRPRGGMLVVTEAVYTVTDPPVKALRRLIPPLSLGSFRIDIAFMVLLLACSIAYQTLLVV